MPWERPKKWQKDKSSRKKKLVRTKSQNKQCFQLNIFSFIKVTIPTVAQWVKNPTLGISVVAQWLRNMPRKHEVARSIPGLAQWVKDLALSLQ